MASVFWSATTNRERNCTCSRFGTKPDSDAQRAFGLHLGDGKEISDISDDEILVFGSHSRNTSCEVKPKRVDTLRSKKVTCEHLFDNRALDAPMKAACEAIDAADAKATD